MLKLMSAAACLSLMASAAVAQQPPAPDKKEKVVCKRVAGTGWRLAKSTRVCRTVQEWDALSEQSRQEYREYGRTGSQGSLGD